MDRRSAVALVNYLSRAHGIVPTTGAEYVAMDAAMVTIQNVANGIVTVDMKPVEPEAPATVEPKGE